MKGMIEQKNGGSVKDIDLKNRRVSGYLSGFGNVDHDNDIFVKGSYSKTIVERKGNIFFLQQHDWSKPLGKFDVLTEDEKGLYFEGEVVNTSFGLDQLKLYEAGIVEQHSVGFQTIQSDFDTKGVRNIKEVKLYEGSAVTLGANSDTPFTGFKSGIKEANNQITKIMSVLKSGNLTDETFMQLELALKQLQTKAYKTGKHSNQDIEPSPGTRNKDYEPLINTFNNFKL